MPEPRSQVQEVKLEIGSRVLIAAPGSIYDGCSGIVKARNSHRGRVVYYKVDVADAPGSWAGPAWFNAGEVASVGGVAER